MSRKLSTKEAATFSLAMYKRLFGWEAKLSREIEFDRNNLVKQGELAFCRQFIADTAEIMKGMRISPDDLTRAIERDGQ